MDAFDWFDIFTRVSPRRVVSIVVFIYVAMLWLHFQPAWDLFDWAVRLRIRHITDSLPTPLDPPSA